ncbi:hydrogenase expression protein HypE [Corynebacterium sphenisci DSM 44792]|uniref:Hydrogenase expression protein HypE n=1 Tax=Corynebacterium sphenisci DSM 44792 TaxID=1437874 RepID=A0A1L7CZN6_9CORY|nr:HypC/HybG/HupF family hydrogenase formation chaperone [Corynebacterium sphenisci]APT91318.1 hydrogenase expression protein HypE [Corynebacterium sphenisci DSM 44792]MDO5730151.1 HypC/HybG/HupF family hydrogenase formation chaperone [Corynebacterium sphenisci]
MCLGVPARVLELTGGPMPMARADFAGEHREICVAYLPEVAVGDHVIAQNGFAVHIVDPEEAAASLAALRDLLG